MSEELDDGCWMEGVVDQLITKASHAKYIGYTTNKFNVVQVKPLVSFGNVAEKYPEEISINVTPGLCWTIVTETNPGDIFYPTHEEELVLLLDNSTLPETGKRCKLK